MEECNEYKALAERGFGNYSAGHRRMYESGLVLLDQSYASVLDIGSGIGWGYKRARELGHFGKWTGVEPCADSYNYMKKNYPEGDWHNLGLMEATIDPADYVFCIEVIEHLDRDDVLPFLKRLRSLCIRGAWVSTPESDRHRHGTMTKSEVVTLLKAAGFSNVVVNGEQWTTLYTCQ